MRDDRGEITEIKMSISYPDGSKKTVIYNQEWISNTGAILMHESCMTEEQQTQFRGSEDWKVNPTFLQWHRSVRKNDCGGVGGGQCKDCCACTSCVK